MYYVLVNYLVNGVCPKAEVAEVCHCQKCNDNNIFNHILSEFAIEPFLYETIYTEILQMRQEQAATSSHGGPLGARCHWDGQSDWRAQANSD